MITSSRSRLAVPLAALSRVPWETVAWFVAASVAVLVALYVVVAGQLLTLLAERRADVAAWVSQRVGMVVEVDGIAGEMHFLTPVLHLRGVRFYVQGTVPATGAHGAAATIPPAFAAPAIDLEVNTLSTLMTRRPVLRRLRLDGLDLAVVEGEDGNYRLRGMPFNVNDPEAAEKLRQALLVVYQQTDILVEHSRLAVESPQVPVKTLENLRLHMHNDGDGHAVSGSAQLQGPGRLSASFVLRFAGEPVVPQDLVADLYLRLLPASLEDWMPRRDIGDLWVDSLSGGGEAWLRLEHARVVSLVGRAQVDGLAVSLADGRKLEGLLGLSTRFRWQEQADGWSLALGGLTFRRKDSTWPESDGALDVRQDAAGNLRLKAMLSRGDVHMLADFADALPESQAPLRAQLEKLAPAGELADLRVGWDETAPAPARWQVATGFSGLGLHADGDIPGIGALSGRLEARPDAGYVEISAGRTQLAWPSAFDQPLPLDAAHLRAVWHRDDASWRVQTDRFVLRNADARASGLLSLALPADGGSPRLALLGLIEDGVAKSTPRYLPRSTGDGLRAWLGRALVDGRLQRGSFLFDGPLRRDAVPPRTFQMRYQGSGLTLAFLPGWPALHGADADVFIEGGRVDAHAKEGRLRDSAVRDIHVTVQPAPPGPRAPAAPASLLDVAAHVDGDLADAFALFREPLKDDMPAELLRWDGSGRLNAEVHVTTRLDDDSAPHVSVEGPVAGATLSSKTHGLEISDVSGVLRYDTRDGFFARDLRGHALDGEFAGSARTNTTGAYQMTVVDLHGPLHMAPLSVWLKLPALDLLRGDSTAALQLRFGSNGDGVLDVHSDLRGIAVSAPPPLAKTPDGTTDARLTYTLGTATPRLTLLYGKNFAADMQLRNGAPAGGAIALGGTKLPVAGSNGLVIEGSMPTLVLSDWLAFVRRLAGMPASAGTAPFTVSRAVAGIVALDGTVQSVDVAAAHVDAMGFPLDNAKLHVERPSGGWLLRVDSDSLDGQVVLPDGYQERGDKPLVVQVDGLALPAGGAAAKFVAADPAPGAVPHMALALNNLSIGGEDYGSWSLETVPDGNAVRLVDVHANWRALDIQGQGRWSPAADGSTHTQFTGTATADDLARVSEAFGFAPNLSSENGKVKFDLGWPGSPLRADPLHMRGSLALDLRAGRFVTQSAKTQALRALGVFNVGTWQRRLKLDFSDLYKKGVAFDTLTGDLVLDNGRVSTTNLVVKGPSALFELSGSTDLATQAISSRLRVTLPVGSNLYVGCLVGLPACAGIVAFEQLWGDKLQKMTTLAYDIGGVWDDPQVKELEGGKGKAPDPEPVPAVPKAVQKAGG